ncbi:SLC13 family permease [Aquiflexum sp. TKW24L]|uniref:SLC13 family permease n=1 Tax=Aquiflexum sp. TKW24L TaxID=2942212 RepID=UPI0020BFB380|nr:SLC13 family permease [Aquiflexum sp. TKW24L]MCL6259453.1 SLC13 family permease [Aquiflexum sp. TKW24L]
MIVSTAPIILFHMLIGVLTLVPSQIEDSLNNLADTAFNFKLIWVLALLAIAIIMFVKNKPRMDAVGVIMIAALPFTKIISVEETLIGFSDPNIILIAVLFVLGEGLVRTGVARNVGDWINKKAGGNETKLLVLLMLAVAGLGSVMSSTAIVAIFIPVVFRICSNTGISPSHLMMPMSFAALISGMLTLISTAPNLVVNSELIRQGEEGLGFFTITPFGLAILALGVVYMLFARKWLPDNADKSVRKKRKPTFKAWIEKYDLINREYRVKILPDSALLGYKINELDLKYEGLKLLAVERKDGDKKVFIRPSKIMDFHVDDILFLDVREHEINLAGLAEKYGVEKINLSGGKGYLTSLSQEWGMIEAIIPAESDLIGKTVKDARLRSESGLTVIGLWRGNQAILDGFLEKNFNVGDTILIAGFWEDIKRIAQVSDDVVLLNMPIEFEEVLPAADKAMHAIVILGLVVLTMITGVLPNVHAVILGCLAMGYFRIIDMNSAYNSISWKSLVLIVGMMPFSIALQRTGGVELAADGLISLVGESAPWVAIASLFFITAVLGLFISNTATAVLMAPIAIAMAYDLGLSPYPFAMSVILAASSAFMTPVSSPVNTLVVAPGNYKFGDFVKIGVPFTIIVMIIAVFLIPLILPF